MNRLSCKLGYVVGIAFLLGNCSAASPGIDRLSVVSLYLQLLEEDSIIAQATGFIVSSNGKPFLITNWHVVTARHSEINEPLLKKVVGKDTIPCFPDEVRIIHHGKSAFTWVVRSEPLYYASGKPRWIEHPRGRRVDVVALPLQSIDDEVQLYPLDLSLADTDMIPVVAMPVSIIGFPLGLTGPYMFPIWKTGHIASEPELDWKSEPVFLIDATTRGGMSGSPVVLRLWGGYETSLGGFMMAGTGMTTLFLGVYSARLHVRSEIGKVWRPRVIKEILAQAGKVPR